jgi:bifunctional NMN adenylyltransferase/nudix hydrolase
MRIKPLVDPKDYEVGTIIGRFQTNKLHQGHRDLINFALENHRKVIILLGMSKMPNTTKNPLDFASRKLMIQKEFPNVNILPIVDNKTNENWSEEVDKIVSIPYGEKKTVIYGSRDSFIPFYSGINDVIELEPSETYNATNIRKEIARETLDSEDFRAGVIYSTFNHKPEVKPFVNTIVHNFKGEILLGKSKDEKYYHLLGDFVNHDDDTLEQTSKRNLNEVTSNNINIKNIRYLTSCKFTDWRHKGESSSIMTTIMLADYNFGITHSSLKDLETKWVKIQDLSNFYGVRTKISPEYRDIFTNLINKIYSENLIPNIGQRLEEVTNVTYIQE